MKGFQEIAAAVEALTEPSALATLVRVKGSSYRLPGARMVFGTQGIHTGVISAGCMETDILARIQAVLADHRPQLAAYDMGSDLDLIWGTGMGCQGRADVLLERVGPGGTPDWMRLARTLLDRRRAGALATVYAARGESGGPEEGDHFLYEEDGPGLPPGPGPFADAIHAALRQALAAGTVQTPTLRSGAAELDLLVEPILPPFALWIFGAGEHARPLAKLAGALGWFVGIIDHRPALATPERFPEAQRIVLGHPPESFQGLPLDRRSAALVVSHIYDKDLMALGSLLRSPIAYLGLQGNRARSQRLLKDLAESGFSLSEAQRQILHFPAGLDIGAESPEAIALSMLAEVQAALAGKSGGPLREWSGPIHH
ncbi:MAG: XdhC family protein [Holophaga sp.]|nr:XdhC family protein [Holophaga sp.]